MPTAKRKMMGLDQYCYTKIGCSEHELAYFRKHPNLHGWMEQLWRERDCPGISQDSDEQSHDTLWNSVFNGIELPLTFDDIDRLEQDNANGKLAELKTTGFFFGSASDDVYRDAVAEFCRRARAELFLGLPVYYNSSW
jgi:hypothetical protein